jgi:hypothetical protein
VIADHLGWFDSDDLTQGELACLIFFDAFLRKPLGGKYKTIEDLMRAKGEEVQRGEIFIENAGETATDEVKALE